MCMFTYRLLKEINYPIVLVWKSIIGCVGMLVMCNVDIETHHTSMSNVKIRKCLAQEMFPGPGPRTSHRNVNVHPMSYLKPS